MSETSNQHPGQDHTGQKTVRVRASELIGRSWLNTGEKNLDLQALRGKIVILDFWTLCCINCLHVLDELRPSKKNSRMCSSPWACTAPNLSMRQTR